MRPRLLLGLISLFLFAHSSSTLAETTHMPGYNCSDLGTTQISDDRTMIVACLAIVPSASPNCANAGTCKWKSMTPVVMDSSQNAALGKTTPAAKLDVVGKTLTSRDGTSECCSSGNYTAAFAENTVTTGRMATLQFHNAGVHEGFLRLATGSPRRFQMGDNQGAGMGLDLNGGLKLGYDASACSSARSGALRWNGSQIQYCNGSTWSALGSNPVAYVYNGVGYFNTVTLTNTYGRNLFVIASGGEQNSTCGGNDYDLQAYVNGMWVGSITNNNTNWAKTGTLSFMVPPGASYTVVSHPWNCAYGHFALSAAVF
ncbi:MAG: hypothetical protein AB7E52_00470 [Bdellovibrionales bacterium]